MPKLPSDAERPTYGGHDRKFFTRDMWLTRYSLACGYVQCRSNDELEARLSLDSSGVYAVQIWRSQVPRNRLCWENFESIEKARAFFASASLASIVKEVS